MQNFFLVGIGGFIGAILRYLIIGFSMRVFGTSFPYGTLIVNVIGCFLIGLTMEASLSVWNISNNMKILITIGILGGLTTFSTFSFETVELMQSGKVVSGILNIILSVLICVISVICGKAVVHIN